VVIDHEFTQRQVPGVEADDVIGTLAARSVDDGYKVIICSYI
jgi:5'-3' exonuclease